MSETIDRIRAEVERLRLHEIESILLSAYYELLLEQTRGQEVSDLVRFASVARKIVSMWADLPESELSKIPEDTSNPASVAARVMYLVAELCEDFDDRTHWYREASVAYLQSGNFPGSATAWEAYKKHRTNQLDSDCLIDAILGLPLEDIEAIRAAPKCITKPWLARKDKIRIQSQQKLYKLSCDPKLGLVFDKSLVYRLNSIFPLFGALSIGRALSNAGVTLPNWYAKALLEARRALLLPCQVPALEKWFASKGNMILCTPTSTGKTFVAEVEIVSEIASSNGAAIFVTPYRAVARGIFQTLKNRFSDGDISVVSAYGDGHVDMHSESTVLVGTPEKIDAILISNPEFLQNVNVVVFDEIHLIAQRSRGAFYEAFISRILLEQSLTGQPKRLLGISAVVNNHEKLADWFKTDSVATSDWRPNPIVEAFWSRDDEFVIHDQSSDPSDRKFYAFSDFTPEMPAWPSTYIKQVGMQNALRQPLGQRCAWFARNWSERTGGPVLGICSSRAQTREFAQITASNIEIKEDGELERVSFSIESEFPFLTLLTHCLRRGVAYHNAALPARVRHLIEDLLSQQLVNVVFATTTLAEGADFPFRGVIIASPGHYDPETERYAAMSPLLLRNIAGRGGRTSGQLIGDVVQMYSPHRMDDKDGDLISSQRIFTDYLLDPRASEVTSELSRAIDLNQPSQTRSQLYSAFDRVIFRWSNLEDAVTKYRNTFFENEDHFEQGAVIENEYETLMRFGAGFGEPLALRASPLKLTMLGETLLKSGFGAESGAVIWNLIEERGWFDETPEAVEIVEQCSSLGGQIPEVSELRVSNRRPLKDDNIGEIYLALARGNSLSEAYLLAETSPTQIRKAKRLVKGEAQDADTIHARFETFADDLKRKLLTEVPAVAKAMKLFVEYKSGHLDVSEYEQVLVTSQNLRDVID